MKMSIANRLVTTKGSASMTAARSDKPKHARMTEPAHYRAPPPARPLGLNASVRRSIRKTTINPESAPTN